MPSNDPDWRLVVLIDQFEELFTLSASAELSADRIAFVDNLLYAASIEGGRTIVILTMRADFYGKCASIPQLSVAVSEHQELVGPMAVDELRRASKCPRCLPKAKSSPGWSNFWRTKWAASLVLCRCCNTRWPNCGGSRELGDAELTSSAYRELGGWEGELTKCADEVFAEFKGTPREDLVRQLFLRLVQPGEGTEDTKRLVHWWEFKRDADSEDEEFEQVIRRLVDSRLITSDDLSVRTMGNYADATLEVVQ